MAYLLYWIALFVAFSFYVFISNNDCRLLEIAKSCEHENENDDNDENDENDDNDDDDDLDEDYEPEDIYPAQIQKHDQEQDFQLSQPQQHQQQQQQQSLSNLPVNKNVEIKKETVQGDSFKQKFFTADNSFVFADKSAKIRGDRKELICSMCGFKCVTQVLMTSHTIVVHAGQGPGMITSCSRYLPVTS